MNNKVRFMVHSAMIAAIYVVLTTVVFQPISYNPMQFRISEMLTVLPFFTPAAIPGLTIGCLISNMLASTAGILDIVFGTLATLIAAIMSYKIKSKILVPLPPVIVNAVIVGLLLYKVFNYPIWFTMGSVGLGQLVVCYGLGYPFMLILDKYDIFKKTYK